MTNGGVDHSNCTDFPQEWQSRVQNHKEKSSHSSQNAGKNMKSKCWQGAEKENSQDTVGGNVISIVIMEDSKVVPQKSRNGTCV